MVIANLGEEYMLADLLTKLISGQQGMAKTWQIRRHLLVFSDPTHLRGWFWRKELKRS